MSNEDWNLICPVYFKSKRFKLVVYNRSFCNIINSNDLLIMLENVSEYYEHDVYVIILT